jgi:hypothetical protein
MFNLLFHYPRVLARHRQGPSAQARERYLTIALIKGPPAIPCCARPVNFWSSHSGSISRLIK